MTERAKGSAEIDREREKKKLMRNAIPRVWSIGSRRDRAPKAAQSESCEMRGAKKKARHVHSA